LVNKCLRVVGVVDGRKWGQMAAATFANIGQVHSIITDESAPASMVAQAREMGVEVWVV
jgi:DeoR/GlpR family transcriptional regulator of sugar metabolism